MSANSKRKSQKPLKRDQKLKTLEYLDALMDEPNIEEELLRYGYAPKEKIILQCNEDQSLECPYIKAVNKNGHTVFVELDVDGRVEMDNENVTIERKDINIVPYSAKIGEMDCSKLDVCGLAFQCTDGICVLTRQDQSLTPLERNFQNMITIEKACDTCPRVGTINSSLISYPIVKMTEIRFNPDYVLKIVDDCTKRLRNIAIRNSEVEFGATVCDLNNLTQGVNTLITNNSIVHQNLKDSIAKLETWNNYYLQNPPCNDEDRDKHYKTQINLQIRNQMVVDLLNITSRFNSQRQLLKDVQNEVVSLNTYMNERFCSINEILDL
jgi:hypothetical protein